MRLILIDDVIAGAIESDEFERVVGARLGPCSELASTVVRQTRAMLVASPRESQFGGYLAISEDGYVVGTGGFKAGPSSTGAIEIAYFTFPPYEGRGHATGVARELVRIAMASPSTRCVLAHTLPERNASTRILEKVGMRFCGEVEDPDDGTVWKWQVERAP